MWVIVLALWEFRDKYSDQETDMWLKISQNHQLIILPSYSICGISLSNVKIKLEHQHPRIRNISEVPCAILPHSNIYSGIIFLIIVYFTTNSSQVFISYLKWENTWITMLRWAYYNVWHAVAAQ